MLGVERWAPKRARQKANNQGPSSRQAPQAMDATHADASYAIEEGRERPSLRLGPGLCFTHVLFYMPAPLWFCATFVYPDARTGTPTWRDLHGMHRHRHWHDPVTGLSCSSY